MLSTPWNPLAFSNEVVTVMNRSGTTQKGTAGNDVFSLPVDAEPLYHLGVHSRHGDKRGAKEGLSWATAQTAQEVAKPVWDAEGRLVRYAAVVPDGYGAMIVGIYRPRFRVSNSKNVGVTDAWQRIR